MQQEAIEYIRYISREVSCHSSIVRRYIISIAHRLSIGDISPLEAVDRMNKIENIIQLKLSNHKGE